jgi:hypothetical protein
MIRYLLRRGVVAALLVLASFISYHAALGESDEELPSPDKTAGVNLRDSVVIAKGLQVLSGTCGGYCHGSEVGAPKRHLCAIALISPPRCCIRRSTSVASAPVT